MSRGRRRAKSLSFLEPAGLGVAAKLASLAIFKGLSESSLQDLVASLHLRVYRKDDLIIQENEYGKSLFLIISGSAVAYSEKFECVLSKMTAGMTFGEIAALYDVKRSASVRASSSICKVAVLEQADLKKTLKSPKLLNALRDRAKKMLLSDSQRFSCLQPIQSVLVQDMKVFDGSAYWNEETVRLFLADAKKCQAAKGAKIPLDDSHVFMIVKGQVSLLGVGPNKKTFASSGAVVIGDEHEGSIFDFIQTETSCVFVLALKSVYLSFLKGISLYDEQSMSGEKYEAEEPDEHNDEPLDRKKARKIQDPKVDFSSDPSSVLDSSINSLQNGVLSINLENCWQISDEGLLFISGHLDSLQELNITDCWPLTSRSLSSLSQLSKLKSLSMANLEAVDDSIVSGLPKSIEALDVSFCSNIGDFGCLSSFYHLEKLTAKRCLFQKATASLPCQLKSLDLSECHHLTDDVLLIALGDNPCIDSLSLSFCCSLTVDSISLICSLKSLIALDVSNLNDLINDMSLRLLMEALPNLKALNVSYNNNIRNILPLSSNLERLVFEHCVGIDQKQHSILSSKFNQ